MGLFDRFKRDKQLEVQRTPIIEKKSPSIFGEQGIYIERADRTYLDIAPAFDSAGNPLYKQIFDPKTRTMQNLRVWEIDYKPQGYMEAGYLGEDRQQIYLDSWITPDMFYRDDMFADKDAKRQTLQYFLVNEMFSRERIDRILEQREHYAGGFGLRNGIYTKVINSGIVNELMLERTTGITSYNRHRNEIVRTPDNRSVNLSQEK